jgi:hypothetical protein
VSFQLKGLLAILLLVALIALIVWAPWRERVQDGMPKRVFAPFDGEWQGRFSSYSISGTWSESFRQTLRLRSVTADSQVGDVVIFTPEGDTLRVDSIFHVRRGDSLLCIRTDENGRRELDFGFWADGQLFWRQRDYFGRLVHAYRERVRKDVWEANGFTRTDRGDYLIQYARSVRR